MIKSLIKQVLRPHSKLYRFFSFYFNIREKGYLPRKIESIELIFEQLSKSSENVTFIQVGSNDGISGDPLFKFINLYNWKGILIEPVPFLFKKLEENYKDKKQNLIFKNLAICLDPSGFKEFYSIDDKYRGKLPDWYFQLGTFYKNVLYHHEIPDIDKYIKVIKVPVDTIENVLLDSGIKSLDIVHIDTEGYDLEILKTINLKLYSPKIVLTEYVNLNKSDRKKMLKLLRSNGYYIFRNNQDFISIKNSFSKRFIQNNILYPKWD